MKQSIIWLLTDVIDAHDVGIIEKKLLPQRYCRREVEWRVIWRVGVHAVDDSAVHHCPGDSTVRFPTSRHTTQCRHTYAITKLVIGGRPVLLIVVGAGGVVVVLGWAVVAKAEGSLVFEPRIGLLLDGATVGNGALRVSIKSWRGRPVGLQAPDIVDSFLGQPARVDVVGILLIDLDERVSDDTKQWLRTAPAWFLFDGRVGLDWSSLGNLRSSSDARPLTTIGATRRNARLIGVVRTQRQRDLDGLDLNVERRQLPVHAAERHRGIGGLAREHAGRPR